MKELLKEFPFAFTFLVIAIWASMKFGLWWPVFLLCVFFALCAGAAIDVARSERETTR